MATIRGWLNDSGFNWEKGVIVHQPTESSCPGWGSPISAEIVGINDRVLDHDFHTGFGGPECPRFVAEDDMAFYFPCQYDGATSVEKLLKNIESYLDVSNPTPYPGG